MIQIALIDVETTFQVDEDKRTDPTPYHPDNRLVSLGFVIEKFDSTHASHTAKYTSLITKNLLETLLKSDIIVAHNVKFDLGWLLACSDTTYDGEVWDTMLAEYVASRAVRRPLDLSSCCERRDIPVKKDDKIKEYLRNGIGFDKMPWDDVEEYGWGDVCSLYCLAHAQWSEVGYENIGLPADYQPLTYDQVDQLPR